MATLSSIGIGSGLDMKTILPALLQVQQAPVDALAARKTDLQSQLSNFGKVQSYMSTLRDSLRKLTDSASWSAVTAASSDTTAVAISASSGSPASSYSVSVQRLASAQQLASAAFADSNTVVGEGSMTIELGRWNADDGSFTAKDGATAVTLEFGPEDNTLAKIRDKINGANAGVMASIVTDASGARLTLRSKETGETSGFRISVEDQDADNTNAAGLSALAYDPASGANGMARNEAAANALASINGLEISAPSNTLTDVIDGLTLTLGKTTSTAVALTVNRDNESIKKAVTDFASAYNDIIKYLRDQTKYNPADKTAGTLQGDRTAVSLQLQLRSLAGGASNGSSVLTRLAELGLDPQSDGSLKVSTTKLAAAVGKFDELRKALANDAEAGSGRDGLALRMRRFVDTALGTDGAVSARQDALQSAISQNDKRRDELQQRVDAMQKRLEAQYTALDTRMAALKSQSDALTQQLKAISNSTSTG